MSFFSLRCHLLHLETNATTAHVLWVCIIGEGQIPLTIMNQRVNKLLMVLPFIHWIGEVLEVGKSRGLIDSWTSILPGK